MNQRVASFRGAKNGLNQEFLGFLLRSLSDQVLKDAYGGAQPNISPKKIGQKLIELPPFNEQLRIVEMVRMLMNQIITVEMALEAMGASRFSGLLTDLRLSILSKAFRGELAPQDSNDEPASVLLERIRSERAAMEVNKPTRGRRKKAS